MRFAAGLLCAILSVVGARAQEPSEPDPDFLQTFGKVRLTLDPGNHVGHLNKVFFSADGAHLITVGNDHAIRFWDARTGEPVRVLRPPGQPGESYPALSPDGKSLAVNVFYPGAQKKEGKTAICLMAVADGRIDRVLEIPSSSRLGSMAFSSNGKYLAAASKGKSIWLWDLTSKDPPREVVTDSTAMSIAVSPDGTRLVEVRPSQPTVIRDLAKNKVVAQQGTHPGAFSLEAVAWSPDGKLIAVASASGLWLFKADGSPSKHLLAKQLVKSVAFSRDSRRLLATLQGTGMPAAHVAKVFSLPTAKVVQTFSPKLDPASHGGDLCALSPTGVLAATVGFANGVHDVLLWKTADGSVIKRITMHSWFSGKQVRVGWSADGQTLAWKSPAAKAAKAVEPGSFDVGELLLGSGLVDGDFKGVVKEQKPYILVTHPNKVPEILKDDQLIEAKPTKRQINPGAAHSFVAKRQVAYTTGWAIFIVDIESRAVLKRLWHNGHVRSIAPSPDGRYLASLAEDQLLRVWDLERGIVALSLHVAGKEWIAWTPEGYYAASPGGERLMGWTVDQGIDQEVTFHPASRFRASLYRPDVIRRVLTEGNLAKALAAADKARGEATQLVDVEKVLPPEVTVSASKPVAGIVTIDAEARPHGNQRITSLVLQIDDRPYPGDQGRIEIKPDHQGAVKGSWSIKLDPGPHDIRVLARTTASLGASRGVRRQVDGVAAPERPKGNLYILAVGIDEYKGPPPLTCAVADARSLCKAFEDHSKPVYGTPIIKCLTNKEASRQGILDGLDWLRSKKANSADLTIFFFAGHGERDGKEFYLVPQDVNLKKLETTGVSRKEIKERMQALPGRVLVLLDACHSGAIGLLFDDLSRDLIDEDCGVAVMGAARPQQVAIEKNGHGLFTNALVGGLGNRGLANQDGRVYLHRIQGHVISEVMDATQNRQHPVAVVPYWMAPFALSEPGKKSP
jgi:WD40 repeat protein